MAANITDDVFGLKHIQKFPKLFKSSKRLPRLKGFLGIVPLAVGVIVLSGYYGMTAICSMMVNILRIDPEMTFGCLLTLIFNISLVVVWTFATLGAVHKTSDYIRTALILWSVFTITWCIIVFSSFWDYGVMLVCVDYLCPDSFWLYNNSWHQINDATPVLRPHNPADNIFDVFADTGNDNSANLNNNTQSILTNIMSLAVHEFMNNDEIISDIEKLKNEKKILVSDMNENDIGFFQKPDTQLVVLLFMVALNGGLMCYSWFVLFSCYFETRCIEDCRCQGLEYQEDSLSTAKPVRKENEEL